MQAVLALIVILIILSLDINLYLYNYGYTTKLYLKILIFNIKIPYHRFLYRTVEKQKDKSNKDKMKEFINVKNLLYYFCLYSTIEDLFLVKYEDAYDNEINIYENVIVYNVFQRISSIANYIFKAVYNEKYQILYKNGRKDEIDGYIHIRNNVFSLLCGYIEYYFKKKGIIKWKIQ